MRFVQLRKTFKHALTALILVFSFVGFTRSHDSDINYKTPLANFSFFHTDGRDIICDSTGEKFFFRGVNLNGLEFGSFEDNAYAGTLGTDYFMPRQEDFDDLQSYGFNVIRVPFEWARLVTRWQPSTLPDTLNSAYLALLDSVVAMAKGSSLYVILDMHDFLKYWSSRSEEVCVDISEEHQKLLAHTWKLLASHFRENGTVLGYDLMNQPVRQGKNNEGKIEKCSSCTWHTIAQSVVDSIREVDQKHLIFVEGPNFSLASNWPTENDSPFIFDTLTPRRIVYSPHVYFDFDNDSKYNQTVGGETEKANPIGKWQYYLRDRLLPAINWSLDHDVPIFIGETNVPCAQAWADLLDSAFVNYFDPFHLSVTGWNYIKAERDSGDLNLANCIERYQLNVLKDHPGGTYERSDDNPKITPPDSRIYDDERVNPWCAEKPPSFGNVLIDTVASDPEDPLNRTFLVHFNDSTTQGGKFAAVKFGHHHGLDTRHLDSLSFRIYLMTSGAQNFKIFTTAPRSDCAKAMYPDSSDTVWPPYSIRRELKEFLPDTTPNKWHDIVIPLDSKIIDPENSIINGIAFQNIGTVQDTFLLDDIRFIPDTTMTDPTSVQEIAGKIPESFTFYQNYPNPFNSSTTIRFKLAKSGQVTLKVYNILGQEIQTLMDSKIEAGEHRVNWQPQNLGSGVYFYRLQTSGFVETRKLILVR